MARHAQQVRRLLGGGLFIAACAALAGPSEAPAFLTWPAVKYPPEAVQQRWEGRVEVEVSYNRKGKATGCRIYQSSDVPILDQAALDACPGFSIQPGRINGRAVGGKVVVPVAFMLAPPPARQSTAP